MRSLTYVPSSNQIVNLFLNKKMWKEVRVTDLMSSNKEDVNIAWNIDYSLEVKDVR